MFKVMWKYVGCPKRSHNMIQIYISSSIKIIYRIGFIYHFRVKIVSIVHRQLIFSVAIWKSHSSWLHLAWFEPPRGSSTQLNVY